jgi:hypothetical protein
MSNQILNPNAAPAEASLGDAGGTNLNFDI